MLQLTIKSGSCALRESDMYEDQQGLLDDEGMSIIFKRKILAIVQPDQPPPLKPLPVFREGQPSVLSLLWKIPTIEVKCGVIVIGNEPFKRKNIFSQSRYYSLR